MPKKFVLFLAAAVAVLLVLSSLYFVGGGLFGRSASAPGAAAVPAPAAPSATSSDTDLAGGQTGIPKPGTAALEKVDPAKYDSNPPKADYEKDIIALAARTDMSDMDKAKALLGSMGSLPPEGQVLALEQATALIPDDQYVQMRPELFSLTKTPELRETMLKDVLTRTEKVRMHSMVEMLRQPPNEAQAEIREILLAYVDEDPGNDWNKWKVAIDQFLKDNGEDE